MHVIKAEHKFQGKGASEGRGVSVGGDPCRCFGFCDDA